MVMFKKFFLLVVFSFFSIKCFAQLKINFNEYTLDNGLHVILHQDKSAPVVAIAVLYHVGSKNERKGKTGFANLFEHLMFGKTKDIPAGQYYKMVRDAGGQLNAGTSQDRTVFYETLPSNQLALGLWLESERMQFLTIDSSSVKAAINIISNERVQRFSNRPYGDALEEIFKHSYKVYPYSWVPVEPLQYVDKASINEIKDFYKTYYVPQNATLSISGDINFDRTKEMVDKYFGGIPKGKIKIIRPDAVEPPQIKEIVDTVFENVKLPAIIEAYHIPAFTSKDFLPLYMIATYLSSGKNSKLYKSLVEKQHLASEVEAYSSGLEAPGLFVMLGVTQKKVDPDVLKISMNTEIDSLRNHLLSEDELQKLKNLISERFIDANSSNAGLAENLAEFSALYGNTNLINTNLQSYLSITSKDIKKAANKYLQKNNRIVLYYLPISGATNKEGGK
jgi:zinc protease